jgi:excisionase family DNA binding protein
MDGNRPLNLREMANALKVPLGWLKEEAAAGRIPCVRAGRQFLFNRDAVENVLAERAAKGEGAK